jgi:hypothetical protein
MAQPLEEVEIDAPTEEHARPQHEQLPGEDEWYNHWSPPIVLSAEAFEKFEKALQEPQEPTPALRALFAHRREQIADRRGEARATSS